jgi:hypothetical protein
VLVSGDDPDVSSLAGEADVDDGAQLSVVWWRQGNHAIFSPGKSVAHVESQRFMPAAGNRFRLVARTEQLGEQTLKLESISFVSNPLEKDEADWLDIDHWIGIIPTRVQHSDASISITDVRFGGPVIARLRLPFAMTQFLVNRPRVIYVRTLTAGRAVITVDSLIIDAG